MKRGQIEISIGVVAVLAAGLLAGVLWHASLPPVPAPTPPVASSTPSGTSGSAPSPAAKGSEVAGDHGETPSFDAVRVAPDGRAVIAGRAAPGAEVTVLDHDQVLGKVTADGNGQFVFVPDKPLPSGAAELHLSARLPAQTQAPRSSDTVAVLVPDHREAAMSGSALAAVRLPQGEGKAQPMQLPAIRPGQHIALDIVEYDASGEVVFTGRSDPAAKIGLFVADADIGGATADASGTWSAHVTSGVPIGRYRLRLDATGANGELLGRITVDLRRAAAGEVSGDYITVVPGNNLWLLARRSYGMGMRYLEIYRANRAKISNPDLIYPGQLLAVPPRP